MNPKSALFISATLTAFVLAILFGVVTKISNTTQAAVAPTQAEVQQVSVVQDLPTATDQPTETAVPTVEPPLGPEAAAALAATAINNQAVYSVESTTYQGVNCYKVVFSTGEIVYIGLDKQVLVQTKLQASVVTIDPTPAPKKHKKNNDNNNTNPPPANPPGGDDDKKDD